MVQKTKQSNSYIYSYIVSGVLQVDACHYCIYAYFINYNYMVGFNIMLFMQLYFVQSLRQLYPSP